MKHGKKYTDSAKLVDRAKLYDDKRSTWTGCKTAKAKFDETVELHVSLGVDSRHADQQVRGAVVLPNGTGKTVRVLVFCKGDKVDAALAAGADYAGAEEYMQKIQGEGWMDFDVVIATPDMMGVVGRLGKVLGPRGLMPSPKAGTVTPDVAKAVPKQKPVKSSTVWTKPTSSTAQSVKFPLALINSSENFETLMGAIVKAKPAAAKGQYLKSCVVTTTMGPGVKVNPTKFC